MAIDDILRGPTIDGTSLVENRDVAPERLPPPEPGQEAAGPHRRLIRTSNLIGPDKAAVNAFEADAARPEPLFSDGSDIDPLRVRGV